jgi:hypothetical protein
MGVQPFRQTTTAAPTKSATVPDGGHIALRGASGTIEGIKKAIDATALGDHWKDALKKELDTNGGNFATVDVHYFREEKKGAISLHITIAPKTILT